MRNLILLIVLLACLSKYPGSIHKLVDFGSYVAKVVWILSEKTRNSVNRFYEREISEEVEKAKSIDVTAP